MEQKSMQRCFWIGFTLASFILFLAIDSHFAEAYFYNITPVCKNNVCIEGEFAAWHFLLRNEGNHDVEYVSIELIDAVNETRFLSYDIPFNPLSDRRGDLVVVKPKDKKQVNLTARLPNANSYNALVYYPCFTTTITDQYIIARDNVYTTRQCYRQNETMDVFECASNENCRSDESCRFSKCSKLGCGDCQYISGHACIDYECCADEQCLAGQACLNNSCINLECNANEYIESHECRLLECAEDEFAEDKACKKLNCSFDERAFNHTCAKLDCKEDEYIENHECKLLECKKTEYAKNHECLALNCLYNETFYNHTCRPLDCYFFQDTKEHECVSNKSVISRLALELLALILIAAFFLVDFKKYKKHLK